MKKQLTFLLKALLLVMIIGSEVGYGQNVTYVATAKKGTQYSVSTTSQALKTNSYSTKYCGNYSNYYYAPVYNVSASSCTDGATLTVVASGSVKTGTYTVYAVSSFTSGSSIKFSSTVPLGTTTVSQSLQSSFTVSLSSSISSTAQIAIVGSTSSGYYTTLSSVSIACSEPPVPSCAVTTYPSTYTVTGNSVQFKQKALISSYATVYVWVKVPGGTWAYTGKSGSYSNSVLATIYQTYTFANGNGTYQFVVTDNQSTAPTDDCENILSVPYTAPVAPSFTTQPASSSVCQGTTGSVASSASGSPTYQWQLSTTSPSSGFSNVSGATSASYTVPNSLLAGTYYYRCVATNSGGSTTSNAATITVKPLPLITEVTTSDDVICNGQPITLTAEVTGATTYSWSGSPAGSGIQNISQLSTTATPTATGDYIYTITAAKDGCTSSASTEQVTVLGFNATITPVLIAPTKEDTRYYISNDQGVVKYCYSKTNPISWVDSLYTSDHIIKIPHSQSSTPESILLRFKDANGCYTAVNNSLVTVPDFTQLPTTGSDTTLTNVKIFDNEYQYFTNNDNYIAAIKPIGTLTEPLNFNVKYKVGTANDAYCTPGGVLSETKVYIPRYLIIEKAVGTVLPEGSTYSVRLYFTDDDLNSLLNTYNMVVEDLKQATPEEITRLLTIGKQSGSEYYADLCDANQVDYPATILNLGSGLWCAEIVVDDFSIFSLRIDGANIGTLPIDLLSFEGKCKDGEAQISWFTATETNNAYFTLERSNDAKDYIKLAEIPAVGESNTI